MKIIIFSSLARDTGCFLRARYLAAALKPVADAQCPPPFPKSLPYKADIAITVLINSYRVIFSSADVYIGIKPFPSVSIPLLIAKWIKHKKVVLDIDDQDAGYSTGVISRVNFLCQKPFPRFFDLITYHNDLLPAYIIKTFGVSQDRLYQLGQGVDTQVFSPERYDKDLRKSFPKDKQIIVYSGHLNVASDLKCVLDAMKIVQESADYTFIIAGGGSGERFFRQRAKALGVKAYFTGWISPERMAAFISMADICLAYYRDMPVNYYRCSMKIREYLAMGRKVVADNVGELRRFEPFIYQTSPDVDSYAAKIMEVLIQETDEREVDGSVYVRRHFDWHIIGKKFYSRLLKL